MSGAPLLFPLFPLGPLGRLPFTRPRWIISVLHPTGLVLKLQDANTASGFNAEWIDSNIGRFLPTPQNVEFASR
jgi:hypothetical protein